MAKENKKIPFPQANDFNKIFKLICLEDQSKIKDKSYLMKHLSLGSERQISYYISACEFLGILNHNREYTNIGNKIRNASTDFKILLICERIISLPVFGEIFFLKYLYDEILSKDDISQLISTIYGINNFEVCKRRASTVIKWLKWIEENKK